MPSIEIRPASSTDLHVLTAIDHSCTSEYVWQLELRNEAKQVVAAFHEVRLPRAVVVSYPRNPSALVDEWSQREVVLVALHDGLPSGYVSGRVEQVSSVLRVTDLVVSPVVRRKGIGSALLNKIQAWAVERSVRRIILETQSKNNPCIRLAQKSGYEFCGYNDRYYPTQDVTLYFGRALK
jgi:ribosomal protein S18 acetylase RimI-like enzyme